MGICMWHGLPLKPGFDLLLFDGKWHHLTCYQTGSLYITSLRERERERVRGDVWYNKH